VYEFSLPAAHGKRMSSCSENRTRITQIDTDKSEKICVYLRNLCPNFHRSWCRQGMATDVKITHHEEHREHEELQNLCESFQDKSV
jgi:hypothetical protein